MTLYSVIVAVLATVLDGALMKGFDGPVFAGYVGSDDFIANSRQWDLVWPVVFFRCQTWQVDMTCQVDWEVVF